MKATDKYQTNRYASADELIADLDNIDFISRVMGSKAFVEFGPDYPERRDDFGRRTSAKDIHTEMPETENEYEYDEMPDKGKGKSTAKVRESSKKKNESRLIAAIAAAALILCGAGIFALGSMLGWFGSENTDVAVPRLTGKTYEQAAAELEALGLVIKEGEQVYSPDQEKGKITSQMPTEGSLVGPGTAVEVNISRGKKDGVVPNIVNRDLAYAEAYLAEFGFKLGTQVQVESHLPKGTVISQSPEAGDKASSGAAINVEVSDGKGKEMTTVPNLYGMTREQADASLAASGLTVDVDNIKYEENEFAPANTVLYQTVQPDSEAEVGTKVGYTLAKAPEVLPPADGEGGDAESGSGDGSVDNGGSSDEGDIPSDDDIAAE